MAPRNETRENPFFADQAPAIIKIPIIYRTATWFLPFFSISAISCSLRVTSWAPQNRQNWLKRIFLDGEELFGAIQGPYWPFWGLCETLPVASFSPGRPCQSKGPIMDRGFLGFSIVDVIPRHKTTTGVNSKWLQMIPEGRWDH